MARRKSGTLRVRNGTPGGRGNKNVIKMAAAAVAGGATGAVIGGLLVRAGVKPTTAAVGVTAAGAVGASTLRGMGRLAAGGAAAAGAGQLALSWLANQTTPPKSENAALPLPKTGRNGAIGFDDIESAFARAREQIELEDEAMAYADGYEQVDDEEDIAA